MRQTKVSARGHTVIPREIREELGIRAGAKLAWSTRNGVIIVVPIPEDPVKASLGILKGKGYTFEDFMEERRRERELEKQREPRLEVQTRRAARRKD